MVSEKKYQGSCLCGCVEYIVRSKKAPDYLFFCHCSQCRKGSGSIHGANIFFKAAELDWLSGTNNQNNYQVPNSRHSRTFCKTCGSPLPQSDTEGNLIVPAGTLNEADELKPTAHIRCKDRASWEDAMENIPRFNEYPN